MNWTPGIRELQRACLHYAAAEEALIYSSSFDHCLSSSSSKYLLGQREVTKKDIAVYYCVFHIRLISLKDSESAER